MGDNLISDPPSMTGSLLSGRETVSSPERFEAKGSRLLAPNLGVDTEYITNRVNYIAISRSRRAVGILGFNSPERLNAAIAR